VLLYLMTPQRQEPITRGWIWEFDIINSMFISSNEFGTNVNESFVHEILRFYCRASVGRAKGAMCGA
jgi:hypothetical protein